MTIDEKPKGGDVQILIRRCANGFILHPADFQSGYAVRSNQETYVFNDFDAMSKYLYELFEQKGDSR